MTKITNELILQVREYGRKWAEGEHAALVDESSDRRFGSQAESSLADGLRASRLVANLDESDADELVSIAICEARAAWDQCEVKCAEKHTMTKMTYTLNDGNTYNTYNTLADACSAAEDWYDYMLENDNVSDELREAIQGADFGGCETVAGLNAAIGEWEQRIATAAGHKDFYGHGTYSVSAALEMGLDLVCREETTGHDFAEGDRVDGGEADSEDYDTGRVVEVDGDQVTVAWDSEVITTQPAKLLRKL